MKQEAFSLEQHLQFCFHAPCPPSDLPIELHNPELRPVLHLLRRDLELVYGPEGKEYLPGSMKPPLVVLLAMLCGIDLLSSMYSEDGPISDEYKRAQALLAANNIKIPLHEVGKKYRLFLREVARLTEQESAFLYVLRNSLAHMYSLNVSNKAYRNNSVTTAAPNGSLIKVFDRAPRKYVLNLWELKGLFLKAVAGLKREIEASPAESSLRMNFLEQAKKSGYIVIEGQEKRPL